MRADITVRHFEKQVLLGKKMHHFTLKAPTPTHCSWSPQGRTGQAAPPPAHGVSRIFQVEEQAAVLGLVAEVGVLGQVEEGRLNVLRNACYLLFPQQQVWKLLDTMRTSKPLAGKLSTHLTPGGNAGVGDRGWSTSSLLWVFPHGPGNSHPSPGKKWCIFHLHREHSEFRAHPKATQWTSENTCVKARLLGPARGAGSVWKGLSLRLGVKESTKAKNPTGVGTMKHQPRDQGMDRHNPDLLLSCCVAFASSCPLCACSCHLCVRTSKGSNL